MKKITYAILAIAEIILANKAFVLIGKSEYSKATLISAGILMLLLATHNIYKIAKK